MRLPLLLVRLGAFAAVALACVRPSLEAEGLDRRALFSSGVKGCVGVTTAGGPATGWIADVDKRWIVTCHHVVGAKAEIDLVFPAFKDGKLNQDRAFYLISALRISGKVLSADPKSDLCLIQAESMPRGAEALPLAAESGQPGDNLVLIGNPAASGAMWNMTVGTLRAVYKKKFTYKNTSHDVEAWVGETQLPANPGDSGAPVLNDRGEVLGIHSGGTPEGIQLMATYIDVTEIRAFLADPFRKPAAASGFDEAFKAANQFFHLGDYDQAITGYSQAIRLKPDHSEVWRSRANAYIRRKLYLPALADCTKALLNDPANAKAYNDRAVCHAALGDLNSALEDYGHAVQLAPDQPLFWAARALTYNGLQQHAKAIVDATEAIRLKADLALAHGERGLAKLRLNDLEGALTDFNEVLKLEADNCLALYNRGVTHASQKNTAAALKDFTDVIRLNPKHGPAYRERGTLRYGNREYKEAIADYSSAIELDPKDFQAYLWRSWCHENLGNPEQAASDSIRAQELEPTAGKIRKQQ